jgi:hypothetical protein
MARSGPMENHSPRKFRAQIPEAEAAPHRKSHLTERARLPPRHRYNSFPR